MKERDTAILILHDRNKRMLFQQRTDDDIFNPSGWALFGGGIEKNETPEQAVKREIQEELGYNTKNPELLYSFHLESVYKGEFYVFTEACENKSGIELKEGQGMAWLTFGEAKIMKFKGHDWEVIQRVYKEIINK